MLFWHIGNQILKHELHEQRAEYGKQIVVTLSRQLSWSHFITLIPIKDNNARNFYAKKVMDNSLSVRELRNQIDKKAFERTKNADIQIYVQHAVIGNAGHSG